MRDCLAEYLNMWKNFEVFCITYLCQLGTEGRTRGKGESYDGDEKAKVGGNRRNDMGIVVVGVQRIWIRERERSSRNECLLEILAVSPITEMRVPIDWNVSSRCFNVSPNYVLN